MLVLVGLVGQVPFLLSVQNQLRLRRQTAGARTETGLLPQSRTVLGQWALLLGHGLLCHPKVQRRGEGLLLREGMLVREKRREETTLMGPRWADSISPRFPAFLWKQKGRREERPLCHTNNKIQELNFTAFSYIMMIHKGLLYNIFKIDFPNFPAISPSIPFHTSCIAVIQILWMGRLGTPFSQCRCVWEDLASFVPLCQTVSILLLSLQRPHFKAWS